MKNKIKLSLLSLGIGSVVMFSCQKKSTTPAQEEVVPSVAAASTNTVSNTGPTRGPRPRMYYNGDGWCHSGMEVNCTKLPEIVVTSSRIAILVGLHGEDPSEVASVFLNTDFEDLNAELPEEYLAALQSGNYYLEISNQDSGKICFFAGTSSPVSESNMEFAIQLNRE